MRTPPLRSGRKLKPDVGRNRIHKTGVSASGNKLGRKTGWEKMENTTEKRSRKRPLAAAVRILGTLLLILVLAACIPLTVPRFFGCQIYSVVSGSMEPSIPVGSLVYIKAVAPEDVQEGDVAAFYGAVDSASIITHRVVENRTFMGELITKGDANQEADINPVSYEQFIGRVEHSFPRLGALAELFTSHVGKIAAGGLIGAAVLLHLLANVLEWEPGRKAAEARDDRR